MKNQTSNAIITDLENAEDIKFGKRDQKAFESSDFRKHRGCYGT